jgi:hypothetical protein
MFTPRHDRADSKIMSGEIKLKQRVEKVGPTAAIGAMSMV